jgi:hypothetical protein
MTPETTIPDAFANRVFFTDKEFGVIIGRHGGTIARWRREGYIKGRHFGSRCVMIPRSELERFIRGEIDFPPPGGRKEDHGDEPA